MAILTTSEKATKAFQDWQAAKQATKAHAKTIRDMVASDTTLSDLADAKKQAAAEHKAEMEQFKAKNEAAYARLDELKEAEQEAKLAFDSLYVACVMEGTQLSLFDDFGASIDLVTRVTIEKRDKKQEPVAQD